MDAIFLSSWILTLLCLIVGLANPAWLERAVRRRLTRPRIAALFGGLTFIFMVCHGAAVLAQTDDPFTWAEFIAAQTFFLAIMALIDPDLFARVVPWRRKRLIASAFFAGLMTLAILYQAVLD